MTRVSNEFEALICVWEEWSGKVLNTDGSGFADDFVAAGDRSLRILLVISLQEGYFLLKIST